MTAPLMPPERKPSANAHWHDGKRSTGGLLSDLHRAAAPPAAADNCYFDSITCHDLKQTSQQSALVNKSHGRVDADRQQHDAKANAA